MTAPSADTETLRRVLLDHHPLVRSETGPLSGCRCGQVKLGQDVIAHVAAQLVAALPPSPAEEAVKRVEAVCDGLEAEMRSMPLTTRMASGALALGLSASRVRAALASPAPAPQGGEQR